MKHIQKFDKFNLIKESFDIDEDSKHLKDLSLDLKDEGEWTIVIDTNTEKYNEDEYSCRVILDPLDEWDFNGPGVAEGDSGGATINNTLIQYLENITKYMRDYEYKIILTSDKITKNEESILNSIDEFKNWIEKYLNYQNIYGYKGDLIIIEFYEKSDLYQ